MPLDLTAFSTLRPYFYHLTATTNLGRLRQTSILESAASLARHAGRDELIGLRRKVHVPVTIDGQTVLLRDQGPLHEGNMLLEDGWTFERFVRHINEHVFFW